MTRWKVSEIQSLHSTKIHPLVVPSRYQSCSQFTYFTLHVSFPLTRVLPLCHMPTIGARRHSALGAASRNATMETNSIIRNLALAKLLPFSNIRGRSSCCRDSYRMVYIRQKNLHGLKEYKYAGVDHSLVSRYILKPFYNNVAINWFPMSMA